MTEPLSIIVPIPSNTDRDIEVLHACRWLLLKRDNASRLRILEYLKSEFIADGEQWTAQD